ncbi:MAG: hypothetical protein ACR2KZ_14685 [Segetibacter sp.]
MEAPQKRVVVVYWKNKKDNPFEVYSSLKNFCMTHDEHNYNTLSNYLSKRKIAFENDKVRIERKQIISKPFAVNEGKVRNIVPVVRKVLLKEADESLHDLEYWLSKPPFERISAVTHIISQSLKRDQRMDKGEILKRKLKL